MTANDSSPDLNNRTTNIPGKFSRMLTQPKSHSGPACPHGEMAAGAMAIPSIVAPIINARSTILLSHRCNRLVTIIFNTKRHNARIHPTAPRYHASHVAGSEIDERHAGAGRVE